MSTVILILPSVLHQCDPGLWYLSLGESLLNGFRCKNARIESRDEWRENKMEEAAWSDESQLLDWQRLAFENADEPSKKADVIRRQLATLVVSSCHK